MRYFTATAIAHVRKRRRDDEAPRTRRAVDMREREEKAPRNARGPKSKSTYAVRLEAKRYFAASAA